MREPAFPQFLDKGGRYLGEGGLTKREYAAIVAMQGLDAGGYHDINEPNKTIIAAINQADALLKALESDHADH